MFLWCAPSASLAFARFSQEVSILEIELWNIGATVVRLSLLFDSFSLVFLMRVLIISARVITFSYSYISTSATNRGFHLTVLLFVLSIISLILRPNLITLILGWDGLGVTSFFLVIFYKRNKSFNAGLLTGLSNRVGDAFILISFVVGFSYSRFSLAVFSSERIRPGLGAVLVFVLAIFTKKANL